MSITNMVEDNQTSVPRVSFSQDRDVPYPKEFTYGTTIPMDISNADDTSFIIQVQKFLKSGLFGVKYLGPVDGNINSILLDSVSQMEQALESKVPNKKFIGTIRFGNIISQSGWNKAINAINDLNKKDKKEENKTEENKQEILNSEKQILEFQKLFGTSQTGRIDSQLIQAAKNMENNLIKELNEPSIKGMIWDDTSRSFQTSAQDVNEALKIINENKNNLKNKQ